jgi:hypothetical protein
MEKLQHWQRVKEIVASALELPAAERHAFLEQSCSHDRALREEVESLLASYTDTSALSEVPWSLTARSPHPSSQRRFVPVYLAFRFLSIYSPCDCDLRMASHEYRTPDS